MLTLFAVVSLICLANSAVAHDDQGIYNIGVGIGDITGPAAGVLLNGNFNQSTLAAGIHTRLFARTFIVQSLDNVDKSVVFVSCDLGMFDHGLKLEVMKRLESEDGGKYSAYKAQNVQISATHTRSGPAGYMQYFAYISKYGFNPLTFRAIVDGIFESIKMAHEALAPGSIYRNAGNLTGYNENREPDAYAANPEEERNQYDANVDTEMISLRFQKEDGTPIGSFNWWPAQPNSFNAWDNPLISSDSPGYAAVTFDYEMNKGDEARPGRGKFVSAFVSSNLGDVNPKIPQRLNMTEKLERVAIIGQAQFGKALELFNDAENQKLVTGPIDFIQQYVQMPNTAVLIPDPETGVAQTVNLCRAALGYSFFGLNATGDPEDLSAYWKFLMAVFNATERMEICQEPKVVALSFGTSLFPWKWLPSKVDLNILRIGTVDIVSMPGEFTTMAGRRLKRQLDDLTPEGGNRQIILSGIANNYINSVATPEEYSKVPQGYAGGGTLFGKYTLNAIIAKHVDLTEAMNHGQSVDPGPHPQNLKDWFPKDRNIPERVDKIPAGRNGKWGDVVSQPPAITHRGEDLKVSFLTPSLRHCPLRGSSHFSIQMQNEQSQWTDVRTDADLDTRLRWNSLTNVATIFWLNIPSDATFGTYRVFHSGCYLNATKEEPKSFNGTTSEFKILETPDTTTTASTEQPTDGTTASTEQPTTTATPIRTTTNSSTKNFVSKAIIILFAVIIFQLR